MLKKILTIGVMAAYAAAMVGCDNAGSVGSSIKEKSSEALAKTKEEITKNIDVAKVKEKIGTLSGEAKTTATAKLADFEKAWDEFKAAPMDKVSELGEKLKKSFEDLKKSAGL